MKALLLILAVSLSFVISGTAQTTADTPTKKKKATKKTPATDSPLAQITDDPKLPRVLLIGDSISMGYTLPVRELLKGKANVHRPPVNCSSTTNGLANLDKWLGAGKWDVIHFNWGLHDLKYVDDQHQMIPPSAYEKNMRELVAKLKSTGAKLIWAATTPVPQGATNPIRKPTDVEAYNAAAKRVMEENKIATDDLYAFALPRLEKIQRPKNVHYTDEGYKELASAVAKSIEAALPKSK